ncbi:hypothetical protein LUD75_13410 [Epilithonimonas sp. JDS]|uniref:beta strand repeat-containing protein n=1 Tax=Epilithonimonas sp. JDS TaxID=2902797 RepID=UPI001E4F74D9|nr:hypothetical protein [Epilithonimonas sp. JDS]MCD9855715.1 hypothetical protein [Epilithonimonas sp. JDS]
MKLNIFLKTKLLSLFLVTVMLGIFTSHIGAQTLKYQQNIRGGSTLIGTSWYYSDVVPAFNDPGPMKIPRADPSVTPSTAISTSADLILPVGSTIVKAFLSVERTASAVLTSVDLKAPGASSYTTINSTNWGSLSHTAKSITSSGYTYYQDVFDITSLIPTGSTGYATSVSGSSAGRYYVAKPTPAPNVMGGWSIIIVYTNPNSKYRSVTVTDNWQVFGIAGATSVNTDISGVRVPSSGIVKAVAGVTGTYGDRGANYKDYLNFGLTTGALTALLDPSPAGTTDNALNSSVAMTANNNVSADIQAAGGTDYFTGGNVTTRNPISKGHFLSNSDNSSESWEYDADIFDASGILSPSSTPVNVRFQQSSTGSDVLVSGSYFVSVDLATEATLTKSIFPTTISDGGTATYTWTITNTSADVVTLNNLGFTDNLPSAIKVAAIPNIVTTGMGSATVTAATGSQTVTLSGLTLASGAVATIKVDVTNIPGQLNASCATNPSGFTNSATNITGTTGGIITSTMTPACLVVTPVCTAGTSQVPVTSAVSIPCGSSAFNLASAHTGTAPGVSSLVWFTTADRSTAALTASQAANATVGTYYAFYFDATANCYNTALSTASVVVSGANCGYVYVHHQATNEEGSPDFNFNVTGGSVNQNFTLNDQTDFLSSEDLGASQSGRLWALARPVTDLTFNNFKIYYRDTNSATWVAIATPAGSPRAIDGGNGSSAIYSTNAASGTTGRVYSISANGTTTDITGNLPAGIVYDVSDNWLPFGSGGRQYASVQNGNIYQRTTSALPAVWTVIANTPSHRVDAVPKTNNVYYVVGNTTTAGSTIFYRDVTAASSINLGTASNSDDMAITEDGTVIAGYKKMSGTPGGTVTWTDEIQGMYGFNVTGGPNNQFWSSVGITNVNNGNTSVRPNRIMTRTATGSWIDDERIRATGTHNDNSVLLALAPGTYTITEAAEPSGWRLQSITTDPVAASDVAAKTATVTVTANATTNVVFSNVNDVAFALPADCTTGFTENFGTTEANYASPTISSGYHNGAPTLNGTPNSAMGYGYYGLIKNSNLITGDLASNQSTPVEYTTGFTDRSGTGRMLGVNATGQPRLVYQKRLTGLTVGTAYNYSAWVRSADISAGSLPNVGLQVLHPTTGAVLFSAQSGAIANANPPATWRQVILNFTATTTIVDIAVASLTAGAWGNDFAVDDISVVPVKPTAPVVGAVTQPTCPVPTGSVALSGLPATGTWTITDTIGGGTITGTGTTATFTNLAPGTHAFTVQLSSTCVSPATSFVMLNNAVAPTAVILAAGPTTVCPSGSVVLTASPATTYQWYNASGAISGATNQEYTATATGTYYVVETENGCTSANSNSIAVTVEDTVAPVFVASTGTQVVSDVIDFDTAPSTAPASASTTFPQSYGSGAAMVTINQSVPGTISYVPIVAPTGTPVPYNSTGKALSLGTNSWVSRTSTLTFPQKIQNLKFSMYDLDGGIQIAFLAYNNGVLQNVTITPLSTTAQRVSVSNNGTTNASLTGLGGAFNDSARQGAVNIDISGPIDSVVLVYTLPAVTNLNTDTNIIADMSFEHIANTQVAATLPANTTVNCNAIPVVPTLLAADNCGTATVVPTETTAANTPAAGQSTITRTWTATDGSGNTTVHTQEIVVNGYSGQPTAAATQNICATNFTTLASVVITGTDIKWYADATTTTVLPATTVLTNGATYYATQTQAGGCESSRLAVTVNLRNCSWINPSLRSKASR